MGGDWLSQAVRGVVRRIYMQHLRGARIGS